MFAALAALTMKTIMTSHSRPLAALSGLFTPNRKISGPTVFASCLGIDTFDSTVGLKLTIPPAPQVTGAVSKGSSHLIYVYVGSDPNRAQKGATGFYLWVALSTQAGGQMIRIVPVPVFL